jgi:hypothetical protein
LISAVHTTNPSIIRRLELRHVHVNVRL